MTADYNGWQDLPEDEREVVEAWEARSEAVLEAVTELATKHGGRVGPTTGAVAFRLGVSYAQARRDLFELVITEALVAYRDVGEQAPRFLPATLN